VWRICGRRAGEPPHRLPVDPRDPAGRLKTAEDARLLLAQRQFDEAPRIDGANFVAAIRDHVSRAWPTLKLEIGAAAG
jgi:hypothetical protein